MTIVTGIAECVTKTPTIFNVGEQVTYTRNIVSDARVSDSFIENIATCHVTNSNGITVECTPQFFYGTFDILIELQDGKVTLDNISEGGVICLKRS